MFSLPAPENGQDGQWDAQPIELKSITVEEFDPLVELLTMS